MLTTIVCCILGFVLPAIVLGRATLDIFKEWETERLTDGLMKHFDSGDMEAAEAYWKEHIAPRDRQGSQEEVPTEGRKGRLAALYIKAGKSPESVIAHLNGRCVTEEFDPLMDAWEESGLCGEELKSLMLKTFREQKQ